MFVVGLVTGPLAHDFKNELYPQAEDLLAGRNPWPEAIWPPMAAVVAMPFTILPPTAANVAIGLVGLACMAAALWLVGVRDWRVYGVVGLWPSVLGDIRIAHLTPLLCLLVAVVWRYRDRPLPAGLGLGVAGGVKFFLWPLGVWLLASGRARAAGVAAVVAVGSVLLVAPFAPLDDYVRHAPRGRPGVRPGQLLDVRAPDAARRRRHGGARRDVRPRPRAARAHVAAGELRARDRLGARALARSSGSTSTRSPRSRSRSRGRACRSSGSSRS